MNTFRHHPESEENQQATRDNDRATFAAKMEATRQRVEPKITTREVRDSEGFPRYDSYAEVEGKEVLVTWDCLSDMLDGEIAAWLKTFHASLSS